MKATKFQLLKYISHYFYQRIQEWFWSDFPKWLFATPKQRDKKINSQNQYQVVKFAGTHYFEISLGSLSQRSNVVLTLKMFETNLPKQLHIVLGSLGEITLYCSESILLYDNSMRVVWQRESFFKVALHHDLNFLLNVRFLHRDGLKHLDFTVYFYSKVEVLWSIRKVILHKWCRKFEVSIFYIVRSSGWFFQHYIAQNYETKRDEHN